MITYIKGILENIAEDSIVVEAGGIGYRIFTASSVINRLPRVGETVKIYIFMSVKDDGIKLYGFNSCEELDIFNSLLTVSGVGPKGALNIVSAISPKDIITAIITGDTGTISKAPGIGKKTGQRIILELKDKFKTEDAFTVADGGITDDTVSYSVDEPKYEAVEALISLGYMRSEAIKAVSSVYEEGMASDELLKMALKKMV